MEFHEGCTNEQGTPWGLDSDQDGQQTPRVWRLKSNRASERPSI
jgi:hypothetical protein